MIEVRELVKKYGSVTAVDHITFSVARGELFGLLGPNGAGKTTTISVLSTLLPGDGGQALVAGIDVARDPQAVRRRIGVVPQEIALYEDLNARENLHFWGRLYGLGGAGLKARVEEMLELVDLLDHAKQRVSSFSGGMKRRLNLAAGLMHNPDVLFLDEPTVGIDAQARSRILELIKDMNRRGLTVLYTTHYLEEAEQLCDRIGVIDRGQPGRPRRQGRAPAPDRRGAHHRVPPRRAAPAGPAGGGGRLGRRGRGEPAPRPGRAAGARRRRRPAAGAGVADAPGARSRRAGGGAAQPRVALPEPHRPGAAGVGMKLGVLIAKDLRRQWRDRRAFLLQLAVPLLITAVMGVSFGGGIFGDSGISAIPIAIVGGDLPQRAPGPARAATCRSPASCR